MLSMCDTLQHQQNYRIAIISPNIRLEHNLVRIDSIFPHPARLQTSLRLIYLVALPKPSTTGRSLALIDYYVIVSIFYSFIFSCTSSYKG
jgi:hypothetical protein